MTYHYETASHPPCERCEGMPCDLCEQLTELEAQIRDLHSRMEDLYQRHRRIRQKRNHVHSPLIHQFPPEIVTTIFTLAFPPRNTRACYLNSHEKESPLILAKVCHMWRELAFGTPSLWCDLSINVANPNYPLLNHQIAHSGRMPLSIDLFALRSLDYDSDSEGAEIEAAMSFAITQLHRTFLLCFNLEVSFIRIFNAVSDVFRPKALPLLEELHVHYLGRNRTLGIKLALEPPCPRRVILIGLSCRQIDLDWTNISSFELDHSRVGDVFPEILASKDLKHLIFKNEKNHLGHLVFDDEHLRSEQIPVVVNPSIQYLTLGGFRWAEFMLEGATLSSLRVLRIDANASGSLGPMIYEFLHRSQCPLQVLNISDWDMTCSSDKDAAQVLINILEITDMLQELTLRLSFAQNATFADLLAQRLLLRDGHFLPLLQTLVLQTKPVPPIGLFLDAISADEHSSEIASGPSGTRPLQDLRLELCTPLYHASVVRRGQCMPDDTISRDDILRILQMRAAGKRISIVSVGWNLSGKVFDLVEH